MWNSETGPASPRPMLAMLLLTTAIAEAGAQDDPSRDGPADPTRLATTARFTLHSSPWINLHHFLFQWARSETEPAADDTRRPVPVTDKDALAAGTSAERKLWARAVEHYQGRVPRYLLFNGSLLRLKVRLITMDTGTAQSSDDATLRVLARAMPVYEKLWWETHDRHNRSWIADVTPLLQAHEMPFGERLARAWGGRWPEHRIRVDLSAYANWAGAYTTNGPPHAVISSRTASGWEGFESVFHEASHTRPLAGDHQAAVRSAFEAQDRPERDRFWHALQFYTVGELTRQLAAREGIEGYRSYAETAGFYDGPGWAGYRQAFDGHWRRWLNGDLERATALQQVIAALPRWIPARRADGPRHPSRSPRTARETPSPCCGDGPGRWPALRGTCRPRWTDHRIPGSTGVSRRHR